MESRTVNKGSEVVIQLDSKNIYKGHNLFGTITKITAHELWVKCILGGGTIVRKPKTYKVKLHEVMKTSTEHEILKHGLNSKCKTYVNGDWHYAKIIGINTRSREVEVVIGVDEYITREYHQIVFLDAN